MMSNKECTVCRKAFLTLLENQKRCQTCIDVAKKHTESNVTLSRRCVAAYVCQNKLPAEKFTKFSGGDHWDFAALRAIFRGRDGGEVAWQGRIDVYINSPAFPAFVRVRVMEVTKQAGITIPAVAGRETEMPEILFPASYQYLALDPLSESEAEYNDGRLVYVFARSKTTLKGLGRQYKESLEGQGIWRYDMSCSCRSGRICVRSSIAIVNAQWPLTLIHREDGHSEETIYC